MTIDSDPTIAVASFGSGGGPSALFARTFTRIRERTQSQPLDDARTGSIPGGYADGRRSRVISTAIVPNSAMAPEASAPALYAGELSSTCDPPLTAPSRCLPMWVITIH